MNSVFTQSLRQPLASLIIYPVIPVWIIVLLLVAGGWWVWRTYQRSSEAYSLRWLLWGLRVTALLILAWLLLQAERREIVEELEPPVLAVAIDVSASLREQLGDNTKARYQYALDFLNSPEFRNKTSDYRVLVFAVGEEVEEASTDWSELQFNRPRSNLNTALNQIAGRLQHENVAGLLFISDGLDHSGDELAARVFRQPLLIPELERLVEEDTVVEQEDVFLAEVSYPPRVYKGWRANLEVLVRRRGDEPIALPLHLLRDGEVWQSENLSFESGQSFQRVRLPVVPEESGTLHLSLQLVVPDSIESSRPRRDLMLEVVAAEGRVLYLEGVPRWDFRFIRQAIESDERYSLTALVRGPDGLFIAFDQASRAGPPVSLAGLAEQGLFDYGLIILGDLPVDAMSPEILEQLNRFVEQGGGLLVLGGSLGLGPEGVLAASEIAAMAPVSPGAQRGIMTEGRFQAEFTAAGRAHSAFHDLPDISQIPPILSLWRPVETHPMATALLATPEGDPVVLVRRYGAGRVGVVLSDSLWRWQLGADTVPIEGKSLYAAFITRLVHWLAPDEDRIQEEGILQVIMARSEFEQREEVVIGATFGTESVAEQRPPICTVRGPDGLRELPMVQARLGAEVGLSRETAGFRTRFQADLPGIYQVVVAIDEAGREKDEIEFLVLEPEREMSGLPIAREKLAGLAESSGGSFAGLPDWSGLWDGLEYVPTETVRVIEYAIWDRWIWLLLLIFVFIAEWWLRRKIGLV